LQRFWVIWPLFSELAARPTRRHLVNIHAYAQEDEKLRSFLGEKV
jgi:hypothetical protein